MNDARESGGSTPPGAGAVVTGTTPEFAGARVRTGAANGAGADAARDRIVWERDGTPLAPVAGTGIAAAILDHVQGVVTADPPHPAELGVRERAIPVDQTHTSVIVDEQWVVKIVGIRGGADRSAEILDRLRASGSMAMPEFLGALHWDEPGRGRTVLALVSAYVPDSEDGWSWAVRDVVEYVRGDGDEPEWPTRLGELIAHMHTALVLVEPDADAGNGAGERAVPGGSEDPRAQDRARAQAILERTFALVDHPDGHVMQGPVGLAARLAGRRPALAAAVASIPPASAAPLLTPHGDLHVGQVLRTADGRYLVLDFDGDPQWGDEQRFRPDGAARDVAHMLTSIDLVAAVAQRRLGGPDERAWAWAERAQQQFLTSFRRVAGPGFLDEATLPGLQAEQLLLELNYAERYLPEWAYAPDGVITRRYPSDFEETEHPWNPPALPTT